MTTKSTKSKKEPEVSWYTDKKGEKKWRFRHRYYDSLGKRREKSGQGYSSENAAIRALLKVKTDLVNGNVERVENSELTVGEWMDIWYETHSNEWAVTSRISREMTIRRYIKPLIGKYKLRNLDKATYKREFINVLLKKFSAGGVSLTHTIFKIAINAAVDAEILPRNRFTKMTIPGKDDEKADNYFTPSELRLFLAVAKERENISNYTLILLLAYTGLRRGEALGLTWDDIDMENKTLTVKRTRDLYGARPPKTKNSNRTILVDDLLIKQLVIHKSWCKGRLLKEGERLKNTDYVFISDQRGTPTASNSICHMFARLNKKSGVKKITPHGLRHTHASILISQRIPVNVIAARLGNTPEIVLSTYSHLFKEIEEESVAAFSNLINL